MTRLFSTVSAVLLLGTTPAFACTEADVLAKQDALVTAIQTLLAVDPGKAQAIVAQMEDDMNAAAAASDEAAVCVIIDNAIAEARG